MEENVSLKKIERKIVQLKAYAFFTYGTSVFYFLFLLIWFNINGMSVAEIFAYNLVVVVIVLIFNNLWSKISDKIKNRILFIIMVRILSIIAIIIVIFEVSFLTLIFSAFFLYFMSNETFLTTFFYELLDERERIKKIDNQNFYEKKAKEFTKYRIMGSIGYACGGPLAGFIIEFVNFNTKSNVKGFQFAFFISIIGEMVNIIYFFIISRGLTNKLKINIETIPRTFDLHVNKKFAFKNHEFVFLLIILFIFELSLSIGTTMKTIYATELGGSYVFVGFLAFVWAWCEVPLFFISAKIVEKYSYKIPVLIAGIFIIIKYLFYIYVITPNTLALFLMLEALNTFGILWPAISNAINSFFAQNKKAFGTSVYLTSMAAARFIGYLLGIILAINFKIEESYESYKILFEYALFITFFGIACFIPFNLIVLKKNKR